MNKQVNCTKQQILDTALNLFSQRGYSAVSIRDIGTIVGIKESTIYYHFKNKQHIFQTLLQTFEEITNAKPIAFNQELAKITKVEKEAFVAVGVHILTDYFLNEQILKFIRMLMIEQHVNKEAADLYHEVLFELPLRHNVIVFQTLIQIGCFQKHEVNCLALEYYSPIFLLFQRYFSCGDITAENLNRGTEELTVYLTNFYDKYSLSAPSIQGVQP